MTKRLILVAGNIGTGKTSITERVGERLGWETSYESVSDNPYLPDFYGDMKKWAYHLQVFFLGHRAEQHLALANSPRSAIADRSIYEDAYIFARALHHMNNLNERDYQSYRTLFDLVVKNLPRPDLLFIWRRQSRCFWIAFINADGKWKAASSSEYLALLEAFLPGMAGYI